MVKTKMKIIVIGGGNVGGFIINNIKQFTEDFEVIGILDDDINKIGKEFWGVKVLGALNSISKYLFDDESIGVVISIANPPIKEKIVTYLKQYPQIVYPNFVHKKTWLSQKVTLGKGNIIYPGVSINYETEIHDFSTINMNVSLGHNCLINNYSTISPGANLAGFTNIGKLSFIGIGACCTQGHTIGNNTTIGAGAVIINDVPDYAVVVGNPGKVIKYNNQ